MRCTSEADLAERMIAHERLSGHKAKLPTFGESKLSQHGGWTTAAQEAAWARRDEMLALVPDEFTAPMSFAPKGMNKRAVALVLRRLLAEGKVEVQENQKSPRGRKRSVWRRAR